jgi:hypothetical protein
VLENYFHPKPRNVHEPGTLISRRKRIFYDTDMISDEQVETVMRCDDCAGVLVIESSSSINPAALCIEIPLDACRRCREEGETRFEKEIARGRYRIVKILNRPARICRKGP